MPSLPTIRRRALAGQLLFGGLIAAMTLPALAQLRPAARVRRARPPEFSKSIRDAFFPDAHEKLVGTRPDPATRQQVAENRPSSPGESTASAAGNWSTWISADAVEDEIKGQQIKLAEIVQNPIGFKGGDYRQAATNLSVLAAMLGIVAEYDGRIRWQEEAAPLRNQVGQAALACQEGTDAALKAAQARSDDLQLLVRGGALSLSSGGETPRWSQIASRPALMKRLEQAEAQRITPAVGSEGEFEANLDGLLHESQVVAALAEVITREGFEYADDETYVEYAKAMQEHALSVRNAVRQGDYEQARQAAGQLRASCANCHDGYRG